MQGYENYGIPKRELKEIITGFDSRVPMKVNPEKGVERRPGRTPAASNSRIPKRELKVVLEVPQAEFRQSRIPKRELKGFRLA